MKKVLCALIALAALDAGAAVSYRLQSSSGMNGRILADGPKVRIESDAGDVILTTDAAKTVTILNVATKTYTVTTPAGLAGDVVQKITNITANARDLGDGGTVEGYPTRRWLLEVGFDVALDVATVHVTMRSESWRTDKLPEAAATIVAAQGAHTGIPAVDKLIESMNAANAKGFPLKDVTTMTTKAAGGKEMSETFTVEVHDIRTNATASPADFSVPVGYTKK